MARARYGNILGIFMLAIFMLVGSVYAIDILSQQDADINVTGTEYEDSYAGNQKIQETTVTLLPWLGFVGMVVVVILLVRVIRK